MLLSSIAVQLAKKEYAAPASAYVWAWRIQNEYPPELRAAAERWAEGLPEEPVTAAGVTLDGVRRRTGASVPQALELMYVLYRDPVEGNRLLDRCTRRD